MGWPVVARVALASAMLVGPLSTCAAVIGFLEEAPGPDNHSALLTNLRLGFRSGPFGWTPICDSKAGPPWAAVCAFSRPTEKQQWSVVHAGKRIGVVTTEGWRSERWYMDEGLLHVTSASPPRYGAYSAEYAGWAGREVHRPLVALQGDAITAPSSTWSEAPADSKTKVLVFPAFKRLVPSIPSCKQDEQGRPVGKARPTRLNDAEIIATLRSTAGELLVGVRPAPRLFEDCDDGGGFASDAWFHVSRSREVRIFPGRRDDAWPESMRPIDVADFDGDGKEEALFWFSGYDEDGYLLFDRDFTHVVRFTWIYH